MFLSSLNEALLNVAVFCGGYNFIHNGEFINTANTALNIRTIFEYASEML
jgi:hypothetical protein